MDDHDVKLRNLTFELFVELGRAPTAAETADAAGVSRDELGAAWRRLHDAHAITLDSATGEIFLANPFSAVPTPYRVEAAGRPWFGICAWDAFGICAALRVDGRIETSCADCGEPLVIEVRDRRPDDESLIFHCLVPAAHWWDDIGFT
jgi:hypothetical protein